MNKALLFTIGLITGSYFSLKITEFQMNFNNQNIFDIKKKEITNYSIDIKELKDLFDRGYLDTPEKLELFKNGKIDEIEIMLKNQPREDKQNRV